MADNPYTAPDAELEIPDNAELALKPPRGVAVGRGVGWIGDSFHLFKQNALMWIVATIVFLVLYTVVYMLGIIPVIGSIASALIQPVITAGIFAVCHEADRNGTVNIDELFAGFRQNTGALVGVGALMLGLMLLIILPAGLIMGFGSMMAMGDNPDLQGPAVMLPFLVLLALMIPLFMAYYFAPALVFFHGESVFNAFKASFVGCLKNILPMLVYGIVVLVLLAIAIIPLGLGLFVLWPMLVIAWYVMYKDIFLHGVIER